MSTVQLYTAPKFHLFSKRLIELSFLGNIPANSYLTIVTGLIVYPFRVLCAKMIFTEEANNNIDHAWFVSGNLTASTTAFPSDENIFGRESPSTIFYGKGLIRVINVGIDYPEGKKYVKLSTHNRGAIAYNINCSIILQEL